jgi:hypothetical protein
VVNDFKEAVFAMTLLPRDRIPSYEAPEPKASRPKPRAKVVRIPSSDDDNELGMDVDLVEEANRDEEEDSPVGKGKGKAVQKRPLQESPSRDESIAKRTRGSVRTTETEEVIELDDLSVVEETVVDVQRLPAIRGQVRGRVLVS